MHQTSIIDHIIVVHANIEDACRNCCIHKELLEQQIFFLQGMFVLPTSGVLYKTVEPISLLAFIDVEWLLFDMHTSEAFRIKLTLDFATIVKATTSGSFADVQWFLPMHIMLDLFANATDNIKRTTTLFVLKYSIDELLGSLLDWGWDTKYHIGDNITKSCIVNWPIIVFRYHIGRQLYIQISNIVDFEMLPMATRMR